MKKCETCGKELDWGQIFTVNGCTQCEECALKYTNPTNLNAVSENKQIALENIKSNNNWSGIVKIICIVNLIVGIIGSIGLGITLGNLISDFAGELLGIWLGILMVIIGIVLSIVSQAVIMTFAYLADDISSIKFILTNYLKDK